MSNPVALKSVQNGVAYVTLDLSGLTMVQARDLAAEAFASLGVVWDGLANGARFSASMPWGMYSMPLPKPVAPQQGELGLGVGRLLDPIIERGEDPAGHFESVVWFPYSARAEAESLVARSEGRFVLREAVAL